MPKEKYLVFSKDVSSDNAKQWRVQVAEALIYCKRNNLLTDFLRGSCLNKEKVLRREFSKDNTLIKVEDSAEGPNIIEKPAGLYGMIDYQGDYDHIDSAYNALLQYIEEQGYCICGDAFELEIIGDIITSNKKEFVNQISIPIERM